jgi:ABC-type protease/lipase transport system fused ATPase/permease subunit
VTRSVETLWMLVAIAAVSLAVFGALDQVRTRLLTVLGHVHRAALRAGPAGAADRRQRPPVERGAGRLG